MFTNFLDFKKNYQQVYTAEKQPINLLVLPIFLIIVFFVLCSTMHISSSQIPLNLLGLEIFEERSEVKIPIENAELSSPSRYVNDSVWIQVRDYLMPNDHPLKKNLDQIFSASRALADMESMKEAGFKFSRPQHHTQIIVTKHPKLKEYVIKAYLDEQEYHSGKPEYYFWIKRIKGARLIQKAIENHKYEHLFKVPKKWIYLLPDEPAPAACPQIKMFILVEEDMDIYNDKKNERLWGGQSVTEEMLNALYTILTELGLFDCAKPSNCPFSRDGRVAFVDTQSYNAKQVKYHKLAPYLSPQMRSHWKMLIESNLE